MRSKYDYREPLQKEQVEVAVELYTSANEYGDVRTRIGEVADQYNFTYLDRADSVSPKGDGSDVMLRHLIVVDAAGDAEEITERLIAKHPDFDTFTLALCYPTEEGFAASGSKIDLLKEKHGTYINYLRPTYCNRRKGYYPDAQKLVDNSICDTVRIKYVPVKWRSDVAPYVKQYGEYFRKCSQLYRDYGLYHRSPTDGFFAVRVNEDSFLITATKTDKVDLDLNRISLVHGYDSASNKLTFSGPFLPSSDAVEAATVFQELQSVDYLVHTHASRQFTRNPAYNHKMLVPPLPYGERKLGLLVSEALKSQKDNDFIIMDDHGEVFAGEAGRNPLEVLSLFEDMCIEAEAGLDAVRRSA